MSPFLSYSVLLIFANLSGRSFLWLICLLHYVNFIKSNSVFSNTFRFETDFFLLRWISTYYKSYRKVTSSFSFEYYSYNFPCRKDINYSPRVELFNRVSVIILVMVFVVEALCNFEKPLTIHQCMYLPFQVQTLRIICKTGWWKIIVYYAKVTPAK